MTNPKYVFWYTDEYHATSVDCLIEYCNLKPPYQERAPILFSSSRVDKTKNNIFKISILLPYYIIKIYFF